MQRSLGVGSSARRPISFPAFARLLIVLLTTAAAACASPAQGDTWWALRAGRDIWHDRRISLVDRYSYTASGRHWPDHEWLWQALVYALHQVGGLPLLTLVVGLLMGATLAISTAAGPVRRADLVVLLLAIPGVLGAWAVRPQMLSMALFALVLWLLRTGRWWWCVPVMLVWANAHGGVVFGGLALGSACLAALWHHRRVRPVLPLAAVTALSALVTLLTPLGTELWHYVLTSGSRPFEQHINEWRPAYAHLTPYTGIFWLWVAGAAALVVVRRRRLATWEARLSLVSTVALLPLAVDATRNMTMFVVAATPLLIQLLRSDTPRERPHDAVALARPVLAAAGIGAALTVALVYLAEPASLGWHPMAAPIRQAVRSCPGHVYTSYDSGAYLIWFTPDVKVFADNRQDPYPERILDLSILDRSSPWRPAFSQYDVRCAALVAQNAGTIATLRDAGWTAAASEGQWVVLTAPGVTLQPPAAVP